MERLILDTSALIDLERRRGPAAAVSPGDDIAIAAVTLAELLHGVLAADPARREAREQFVDDVRESIEVLPYTKTTAVDHAALLDHVRRTGTPRGAHDLIIAAHARQSGRRVVTRDAQARFGDLPGVNCAAVAGPPGPAGAQA